MAIFKGAKNRDDTFVGTEASDRFVFDPADLTAGDFVFGGDGTSKDVLVLTRAGAIGAEALANVGGIEAIQLADGGSSIVLMQQLADSAAGRELTVSGGGGNDTIDGHLISNSDTTVGYVTLAGGDGNDTLIGGSDYHVILDGGAGRDTIDGVRGTVVYDGTDIHAITTERGFLRVNGAATIDLTRTSDQSLGDRNILQGFGGVDASRSIESVVLTGGSDSALYGGSSDDRITGGYYIEGGKGADVLIGSTASECYFILNAGDFEAGETIIGRGTGDDLELTGSVDLRIGSIRGIDYLGIEVDASSRSKHTLVTLSGTEAESLLGIFFPASTQDVRTTIDVRVEPGVSVDLSGLTQKYGSAAGVLKVTGSDLADHIVGPAVAADMTGGGGDDTVETGAPDGSRIDGGAGSDTLVYRATGQQNFIFDLSSRGDQSGGDSVDIRHFENLDFTGVGASSTITVTGSASDNRIVGGLGNDTFDGGRGNDTLIGGELADTLDGGAGDDIIEGGDFAPNVLTGGTGADTFRWAIHNNYRLPGDTITDFGKGADTLQFAQDQFDFFGKAFDTLVVASTAAQSIKGADLVIYTGGTLDSDLDVSDYLRVSGGGSAGNGLFVAGLNSEGHTVLFHATDAQTGGSIMEVADLGDIGTPTHLVLTDFSFI